ncbi:MAG: class I SAM-dependent methyltransferase [bacterium]|nr:class I SAM-dependent methyltransferase [bacterium]
MPQFVTAPDLQRGTLPDAAPAPTPSAGACALCGAVGTEPVAEQVVPDLAPAPDRSEWPIRSLVYHGCARCGTVSQWPLPDAAELDRYYATVRMARHVPEAAVAKQIVYEDRLELLRRVTGLGTGTCLEVGCGNGLLLELIARRWGLAVHGLEPSSTYDTRPDVPIARCTLQDFAPRTLGWPGVYDLVYCRHVLEHVTAPALFLRDLSALVAPGGWLYVEVPSSALHATGGLPASGQNIHAVHLHHYAGPGLAAALAARGLTVTHLEDRDIGRYPSLCVAARRGFDAVTQFRAQLDRQQDRFARAAVRLAAILQEAAGAPVVVWGAGADLGQVLPLVPAAVRKGLRLYDRSPTKQGRRLLGVPILDDAQLAVLGPVRLVAGCGNRTLVDDILAEAAERFPQAAVCELFESRRAP